MHIPKTYRNDDQNLMTEIINQAGFALLISHQEKLRATHCMMLLNDTDFDKTVVEAHISKANPQAKELQDGDEVLLDFLGAHTYISSSWYNHINASTWNYEAVQIYGKVQLMNNDQLYNHLARLTTKYERPQKCPMYTEQMGEDFVKREMKGAFGFFVFPTETHVAQKLSQNRTDEDYQNIIKNLVDTNDAGSMAIAEKMKKLRE